MVKAIFNLDDDESPEITIAGGIFAAIAIIAIADFLITGGQTIQAIISAGAGLVSALSV